MIKSMTGFGKAELEINNKKITIEIKSLNSKQIDINTRIPSLYREKDIHIRKILSENLERGKIDFNMYVEYLGEESNSKINEQVVKDYYRQLKKISTDLDIVIDNQTLLTAVRLPDAIKTEYETLDEQEWEYISENISKALDEIKVQKLWQQGKEKEYHSQVSDVIRKYIEERFDIYAMEMTSDQIFRRMRGMSDADFVFDKLKQLLLLADLVKFAKYHPLPEENELSMMDAYLFVNGTKKEENPEIGENEILNS